MEQKPLPTCHAWPPPSPCHQVIHATSFLGTLAVAVPAPWDARTCILCLNNSCLSSSLSLKVSSSSPVTVTPLLARGSHPVPSFLAWYHLSPALNTQPKALRLWFLGAGQPWLLTEAPRFSMCLLSPEAGGISCHGVLRSGATESHGEASPGPASGLTPSLLPHSVVGGHRQPRVG